MVPPLLYELNHTTSGDFKVKFSKKFTIKKGEGGIGSWEG